MAHLPPRRELITPLHLELEAKRLLANAGLPWRRARVIPNLNGTISLVVESDTRMAVVDFQEIDPNCTLSEISDRYLLPAVKQAELHLNAESRSI